MKIDARTAIKIFASIFILAISAFATFFIIPRVADSKFNFNQIRLNSEIGNEGFIIYVITPSKDTVIGNDEGIELKIPELRGDYSYIVNYKDSLENSFTHENRSPAEDYIYDIIIDSNFNVEVIGKGFENFKTSFKLEAK